MRTETLKQSIEYVLSLPNVQRAVAAMEATKPLRFIIKSINTAVTDYHNSIITVVVNFEENPSATGNIPEDIQVTIKGTALVNFQLLDVRGIQVN
jgi:hypothetical protein